jgi:hypothetical protein
MQSTRVLLHRKPEQGQYQTKLEATADVAVAHICRIPAGRQTDQDISFLSECRYGSREYRMIAKVVSDARDMRWIHESDYRQLLRSFLNRPVNSSAKCWASQPLPPFPQMRTLPSRSKQLVIKSAILSISASVDSLSQRFRIKQIVSFAASIVGLNFICFWL